MLVPLAVGTAYLGGWPFAIFGVSRRSGYSGNGRSLVAGNERRPVVMIGGAALLVLVGAAAGGRLLGAVIVIAMGVVGPPPMAPAQRAAPVAGGVPYAGAIGIAPIVLRSDGEAGFVAVMFLFAIVWTTDIVAYFLGRLIGRSQAPPAGQPQEDLVGRDRRPGCCDVLAAIAVAKIAGLSGLASIAVVAAVAVCRRAGGRPV